MSQFRYLTAIVYTAKKEPGTKSQFLKYRNIKNTEKSRASFINSMKKKFASAEHVNFYDRETEEFFLQVEIV